MDVTDPAEPGKSQSSPAVRQPEKSVDQSRREAIQRLMLLGIVAPTASILIDMKVSSAFAEPGT